MFDAFSPTNIRFIIDQLISKRCSCLTDSDIRVPGGFSRPQKAVWSPEQIVTEILSHKEGALSSQLLDNHKFQKEKFLHPVLVKPDPSVPLDIQIKIPDAALTAVERARKEALTVSCGYPPKTFAAYNRMKCRKKPTVSGFCQARVKLSSDVCRDICESFTEQIFNDKTIMDLDTLVFAIDGSTVPIVVNYEESGNIVCTKGSPRAGLHLNAACCLNAGNILACLVIQSEGEKNEHSAAYEMIQKLKARFPDKRLVFIMDRLYFSYKLAFFCQENDIDFIIRIQKRVFSKLSDGEPADQPLDRQYHIQCTSRQDKDIRSHPDQYRYVPKKTLEAIREELEIPEGAEFTLDYRLAALPMPQEIQNVLKESGTVSPDDADGFTYLCTTLSPEELPAESLGDWYFWRWQIEVSYGCLKYKTGLNALHSKKENNILQEIWISVMKYNAECLILARQTQKLLKRKRRARKKGKRPPGKNPKKPSQKTQIVQKEGEEPVYTVKISFAETARNFNKFLLGQVTEEEMIQELEQNLIYTLPNRHTPRGTTCTRVHGFHWSFH